MKNLMPSLSINQECPAGRVLRQAFAENIPQRRRNGQFAATAKIQRDVLHKAMRAKSGLPSLPDAPTLNILTDTERAALLSFYVEEVCGPQTAHPMPSAAHAGRAGKIACAAVLTAALIMIFAWDETIGAVVSALPIPKLVAAAFGRIV